MRLWLLSCAIALMLWGLIVFAKHDSPARADCSVSSWHPDYTQQMKERCRSLGEVK